jgi:transcriptional regulator with XRE-family HTH domain
MLKNITRKLQIFTEKHYICTKFKFNRMKQDLNRLKVVLVERKRTSKWLAEELGKNPTTISKWCQNKIQPDLSTLNRIANLLNVDIKDLIVSTKDGTNPAKNN